LRMWIEAEVGALEDALRYARPAIKAEISENDRAEYTVWYCTNRQPNDPADAAQGFSSRRDKTKHYGTCRVFVPKSHKIGSTGSPWWKRFLTMTDDRLRLLEIKDFEKSSYWQSIAAQLATASLSDRIAVVFIHGYRVSFEDAALRTAQIGFDLSIRGVMAFFSWPSLGTVSGYPADEAAIEASEAAIGEYLLEVLEQSGAKAVHMIAHSMGNRGVLRAIDRIVERAQQRSSQRFGQIVLAAPDVDADTFRQLCPAYTKLGHRTTLYVSARDLAIETSHWLHQFPRAGLIPPVVVCNGIDTINVTNADLTMLGHGYVAQAKEVLQDLHSLIFRNAPPAERFGLRETATKDGERFWLIGR
jgi:esterase/lipase superfamily enzyme